MTQFALCVIPEGSPGRPWLRPLTVVEPLLRAAAEQLFPKTLDRVRVPYASNGASIGDVSDDAQNKVVDGEAFEDTEFGRLAGELSRRCSEWALGGGRG